MGTSSGDRDGADRLPIKLGPASNGEFLPPPMSPVVRETIRRTHALADERARRLGISRRRFLSSLSGAAATLFVLNACARDESRANGDGEPGGTYDVTEESTIDEGAAAEALGGDEFIMDVQTHFLDFDLSLPPGSEPLGAAALFGGLNRVCDEADPRACFSIEAYFDELFLRSDTSLAVLSALPVPGDDSQLPIAAMDEARRLAEAICQDPRVLMHGGAYPHVGGGDVGLDAMTAAREQYEIAAWKIYTMVPRTSAFFFDDHDPALAPLGQVFIDHVRDIGPPIICTHRGISAVVRSTPELCSPADIGPAAAANPDITFVVYHSGYEPGTVEGPYEEATRGVGINRLLASLEDAGVGPGQNVYAELGGTWNLVVRDPDAASHTLGKLLVGLGEDNVVWGTDSIWFGTPQDQIQAFRSFQISEEYQERFGYPALTDEVKRKILGLNSARIYDVDPEHVPCEFSRDDLVAARTELTVGRSYGPSTQREAARLIAAHQGLLV